jgi:phenylalanyl-tRNA synthetase alpha chain
VKKGPQFSTSTTKPETDLTVDMLTSSVPCLLLDFKWLRNSSSGSWKTSTYKKYNFETEGIPTSGGALHPLLKVREEIRNIFLEMG